jgi:REP element-mobilizing transposase RayT
MIYNLNIFKKCYIIYCNMKKHHYKSDCNYHIVICPKYRHKIMINDIQKFLKVKFKEICKQ